MQDVSEAMIRAIFKRAAEPTALLVTITAEGLETPIRASSDPDGTESRGDHFPYFPFTFGWGGAAADEPVRGATLEIGNTDGEIALAVRTITGAPLATVEVVRTASPDVVELAMVDAKVSDVEVDDPRVTAQIIPKNFEDEPACKARYIMARTPGLV